MKLLVVVAEGREVEPMKRLLAQAGIKDYLISRCCWKLDGKPSMKEIRALKPALDEVVSSRYDGCEFDYIIAAGETAARMVLDTSTVNINKLRGRDFEYAYGVKKAGKKAKADSDNNSDSGV